MELQRIDDLANAKIDRIIAPHFVSIKISPRGRIEEKKRVIVISRVSEKYFDGGRMLSSALERE